MRRASPASRPLALVASLALLGLAAGCAFLEGPSRTRHATSVMQYLHPGRTDRTESPGTARLHLPLRVGIAFVPDGTNHVQRGDDARADRLPETFKTDLAREVARHFQGLSYVRAIEVIPTAYLQPGGGFDNLGQVARLFDVDVVALLSFDQVQSRDAGMLSLTYWTLVGAYVVPAENNATTTLLDAAVFDVASRRMLFRAPGVSQVAGRSTPVNVGEALREDAQRGFQLAATHLVANLRLELDAFRQRIRERPDEVQVIPKPGDRTGAGAVHGLEAAGLVAAVLLARRRSSSSPTHETGPGLGPDAPRRHPDAAGPAGGWVPWILGAAMVVAWWPQAQDALVWDRNAILAGQAWRWFTGHGVHFSAAHLVADVVALAAAAACIGPGDSRALHRALWLAACLVPAAVLVAEPDIARYGGLSGLAMAAWTLAAARRCAGTGRDRILGMTLAAGAVAKLVLEGISGSTLWAGTAGDAVPCISAHLAGAACGVVAALGRARDATATKVGDGRGFRGQDRPHAAHSMETPGGPCRSILRGLGRRLVHASPRRRADVAEPRPHAGRRANVGIGRV